MKLRRLFLVICACLLLTGCPAFSLYPLYTDQDTVGEPGLAGTWRGSDPGDSEEVVFERSGAREYSMEFLHSDAELRDKYKVHLVQLQGKLFMDLIADEQTLDGAKIEGQIGTFATHLILKVKISEDDLSIATLEGDAIKKHNILDSARLDYQITHGDMLLTTPTDILRRYVVIHADDAFDDFAHLRRIAKPPIQK